MSKQKPGLFERIIQILSSEVADKVLTGLDKKVKSYITDFIHDVMKKVMIMVVGFVVALIGSLFLFVAFAKFLNEVLGSMWMGWAVGGLVTLAIGLVVYIVSRR